MSFDTPERYSSALISRTKSIHTNFATAIEVEMRAPPGRLGFPSYQLPIPLLSIAFRETRRVSTGPDPLPHPQTQKMMTVRTPDSGYPLTKSFTALGAHSQSGIMITNTTRVLSHFEAPPPEREFEFSTFTCTAVKYNLYYIPRRPISISIHR